MQKSARNRLHAKYLRLTDLKKMIDKVNFPKSFCQHHMTFATRLQAVMSF